MSRCLAVAQSAPATIQVGYLPIQDTPLPSTSEEVVIRFIGHSTFLITSPGGVTIATDYNGYAGPDVVPQVVTMNQAHSTHYTNTPDPQIEHVLRGWDPAGGPAEHNLEVGDVLIRNVTTDIRGFGFGGSESAVRIPDGNSIFIFEMARLCIGHLGHLHHVLDGKDLAFIGQLDIVMVPVDGSYTMDQTAMVETLSVLKARLILPMHYFGAPTLQRFLTRLGEDFAVEINADRRPRWKRSTRRALTSNRHPPWQSHLGPARNLRHDLHRTLLDHLSRRDHVAGAGGTTRLRR